MRRVPGWRSRFEAAIDEIKYRPFDWAQQHDCGLGLCARIVTAITGEDVAASYRGTYTTREEALEVMRATGFENLGDLVASLLPEIHPSKAKIGDVAAFPMDTPFGYGLGVVNGERVLVLREEGIGTMELLQAQRAFKVG